MRPGLRNRAGGDRANKDHYWRDSDEGREGDSQGATHDPHVSCYIMRAMCAMCCSGQGHVCLNYLTGW